MVVETAAVAVLHRIAYLGHVREPHGLAVLPAQHQVREVGGVLQLAAGGHQPAVAFILQKTLGRLGAGGHHHLACILQRHAQGSQRAGLETDAHGWQRCAAQRDLAHPLHARDLLQHDVVGQVVELAGRKRGRRQRQRQDGRRGGIELAEGGPSGHAGRQLVDDAVDGRLHLARGLVQVAVDVEEEPHLGGAGAAGRRDGRQPRNGAQRPFQRPGHGRRHAGGAGPGQAGRDHHHRRVDLRQGRHRQLSPRQPAGQQDGQRQHGAADGSADEGAGQIHRLWEIRTEDGFIGLGQSRQGRAHGQQVSGKNGFIGLGAARSARRTGI